MSGDSKGKGLGRNPWAGHSRLDDIENEAGMSELDDKVEKMREDAR